MEHFVFYSSLAYNVVLNRLKYRNWFDRIDNNVILGALPFKGKFSNEVYDLFHYLRFFVIFGFFQLIQEENVAAVISMNQDYELKPFSPSNDEWKRLGVEFLQLPTKDFYEVPSLDNLRKGVSLIEKYATLSKDTYPQLSVYIHCKAGRTRSATLVACYLIKVFWIVLIA